jgi:hypothetical protein
MSTMSTSSRISRICPTSRTGPCRGSRPPTKGTQQAGSRQDRDLAADLAMRQLRSRPYLPGRGSSRKR